MNAIEEKYMPHNAEDEIVALGLAILAGERLAHLFAELFIAEDFFDPWRRSVHAAILELVEGGQRVNPHAVWHRVSVMPGINGQAKTLWEVVQLQHGLSGKGDQAHMIEVLNRLRPLTIRRRLWKVCNKFATASLMSDEPSFDAEEDGQPTDPGLILAQLEEEAAHMEGLLNVRSIHRGPERIEDMKGRLRETLVGYHEQRATGLPTGLTELDEMLDGGGMQPQGLYVPSGPPKTGKTSLLLCIANHVAQKQGKAVGIIELEMHRDVLMRRLFSIYAGIPYWMLRKGFYGAEYEQALRDLEKWRPPILIEDQARHMGQIRRAARRMVFGPERAELIIVDYLQLIALTGKSASLGQRTAEVSAVSRELKNLAGELNVPFLVVSNMNRDQGREDRRPELMDLRESGQIEFDAESVWFLFNPNKRKGRIYVAPDVENLLLIVAAQRNGPTGDVDVKFIRQYMQIITAGDMERARDTKEGEGF
jgi:replicative DNA helicase